MDQGGYSYQLLLDGGDVVMRLESITQEYPSICGTYSYSIELADPSQSASFDLVGDEITVLTDTLTEGFTASMTVRFSTDYHEEAFIDPVAFSLITCEAYQLSQGSSDFTMQANGHSSDTVIDLSLESTKSFSWEAFTYMSIPCSVRHYDVKCKDPLNRTLTVDATGN